MYLRLYTLILPFYVVFVYYFALAVAVAMLFPSLVSSGVIFGASKPIRSGSSLRSDRSELCSDRNMPNCKYTEIGN